MDEIAKAKYYISWFRLAGQDGYLLWLSMPNSDAVWADADGRIPVFSSQEEVRTLAQRLGVSIENQVPILHAFDTIVAWMNHPEKAVPCHECLGTWNMFDDVATGVGQEFVGQRKGPVRNRLYDKLFLGDGIVQINQQGRVELAGPHTRPWIPTWRRQERKVLRRILQQGFWLWKKYTYYATEGEVKLPV